MLHNQYLGIYTSDTQHPDLPDVTVTEMFRESVLYPLLSAGRPKQELTLGRKTADRFEEDRDHFYNWGVSSKGTSLEIYARVVVVAWILRYSGHHSVYFKQTEWDPEARRVIIQVSRPFRCSDGTPC